MIITRLAFLLLTLTTASSNSTAAPRAHELTPTYTFSQYLSHFSKSYDDPDEYARRSAIFYSNLSKILKHNEGRMNEMGKVVKGYVMGVNQFTDLEPEEIPMGYNKLQRVWRGEVEHESGLVTAMERRLDGTASYSVSLRMSIILCVCYFIDWAILFLVYLQKPVDFQMEEVADLPESVDWSDKVSAAPNQGGCGDCWAFAATACVESQLAIAENTTPVKLSETSVFECSPNPQHCGGKYY
jgi:cathepsin L